MPEKDLMPYLLVCLVSAWGGIASYIRKLRAGLFIRFSLAELVGEVTISGFVGFLTFFLCQEYRLSMEMTAVLTGICAHMGSRAIFTMEVAADNVLRRWGGVKMRGDK